MIRIGKTYGNLMVDVQTGSEKLPRSRPPHRHHRHRPRVRRGRQAASQRAHWNVKAAIVMQKSGLTYPQALSRLRQAHDFVRDAIGEDVEARLKELLKVGYDAARSSHISRPECSCRNDAGSRGVSGPSIIRRTQPAFAAPVASSTMCRALRIVAIPIESASRGTIVRAVEQRCVRSARARCETRQM